MDFHFKDLLLYCIYLSCRLVREPKELLDSHSEIIVRKVSDLLSNLEKLRHELNYEYLFKSVNLYCYNV